MAAEEEAGVALAYGHLDFAFEDEVGIALFGEEEPLALFGCECDDAVGVFGLAEVVGVVPVAQVLVSEEVFPRDGVGVLDPGLLGPGGLEAVVVGPAIADGGAAEHLVCFGMIGDLHCFGVVVERAAETLADAAEAEQFSKLGGD